MDTTPLVDLFSRLAAPGRAKAGSTGLAAGGLVAGSYLESLGPGSKPATGWRTDARRSVGQVSIWLALFTDWNWWTRLLIPVLPILAEQLVRSGDQHRSCRYLGFMPPTALYRSMYPAPKPAAAHPPVAEN